MIYTIGIYEPNSYKAALQTFDTMFPLITNSYSRAGEVISYINVNEIIYKAVKTTIFEKENLFEQILQPKSGGSNNSLLLKGILTKGDLIEINLVTQSDKRFKQIKVPILPRTNSDYIKIDNRYYQCWELIHSKDKIQVVVSDNHSEDK